MSPFDEEHTVPCRILNLSSELDDLEIGESEIFRMKHMYTSLLLPKTTTVRTNIQLRFLRGLCRCLRRTNVYSRFSLVLVKFYEIKE